jgi:16S rRNA (guanine527-N7)-methyltransferase
VSVGRIERLQQDAASLGVTLTTHDAARLFTLIEELADWNSRYNLTGIREADAMITHHLLDSLAVHPDLHGDTVADVGTGAGFPGLPLAVCNPARHFTLIDATAKKLRFVSHMVERLGLTNVSVMHARVEALAPRAPFGTVVARAFAPLPRLLGAVAGLVGPDTHVLAMKGKWPQAELDAVPKSWRVLGSRELEIPGLDAARCLIVLVRAG